MTDAWLSAARIGVFCHSIRSGIGTMAAVLRGVDSRVFTGGVGAHAVPIRREVCRNSAIIGVRLDEGQNSANASVISADASGCTVHVVETDEERMIARSTRCVLKWVD
jgi:acetate kinase